jgi:hypothetical protein
VILSRGCYISMFPICGIHSIMDIQSQTISKVTGSNFYCKTTVKSVINVQKSNLLQGTTNSITNADL